MPVSAGEYVTHIEIDEASISLLFRKFWRSIDVMFEGHVIALSESFAKYVGNGSILAKKVYSWQFECSLAPFIRQYNWKQPKCLWNIANKKNYWIYHYHVTCYTHSRVVVSYCLCYYISITIVPSCTRKYHEFVAVCVVTSAQHK